MGTARRPITLRSRLWAVARQLEASAAFGQEAIQAYTMGCAAEQCARTPWTLALCRVEHTGPSWGEGPSAQKVA